MHIRSQEGQTFANYEQALLYEIHSICCRMFNNVFFVLTALPGLKREKGCQKSLHQGIPNLPLGTISSQLLICDLHDSVYLVIR